MKYVSDYQNNHLKDYKMDPLCFKQLTNNLIYVSPEKYHHNLLKGMLEHILLKFHQGITKFENKVDLRISLSYILNDFALLKNQALTNAQQCSTLEFDIRQGVKIKKLNKYLEEEEIFHDKGFG